LARQGVLLLLQGLDPFLDRIPIDRRRLLVSLALLAVAIAAAVQVPIVVIPLVLGVVLAATLSPFAGYLRRRGWPPGRAALVSVLGATIAVVMFSTASFILDSIPQVDWIHPYLITHNWLAFGDLFRDPVAWQGVEHGLYAAAAYAAVFWALGWARLTTKDVTS
jgi:predicted PurR-regulated permease PerM